MSSNQIPGKPRRSRGAAAFTLIELMVVMLIIGILASITVPAMKGMGQANRSAAAHRQFLDDIGLARLRAINDRSPVYVVFPPVNMLDSFAGRTTADLRQLTNVYSGLFTSYAIVSTRTVGDQPGRPTARYLTEWKSLPEGLLFATQQFGDKTNAIDEYKRSLRQERLPFPNSRGKTWALPCLGFNAQGQLISRRDEIIVLARGSVFTLRTSTGALAPVLPDVQYNPPVNLNLSPATQTNNFQFFRINWLTGRAKVELPDFQ